MLGVIGMLSAAAGAYYYLRIVVVMYLRPAKGEVTLSGGWPVALAVGVCASLTLLLGLYSTPIASAYGRPPAPLWNSRRLAEDLTSPDASPTRRKRFA